MRGLMKTALIASLLCLGAAGSANATGAGINYLVAVTQMKSENANEDALHGADDQRSLIQERRRLREHQRSIEEQPTQVVVPTHLCRVCLTSHQPMLTRNVDNDDSSDDDSDD